MRGVGHSLKTTEIPEFFGAMEKGKQEGVRGYAKDFFQHKGADEAFQMIDVVPSHVGIEGPSELGGNKLLEVDMLFQKFNEFRLLLFHGLGHTVVDIP